MGVNRLSLANALLAVALAGCVAKVPGKGQTTYHVIFGFGVVAVNESPDVGVIATDLHAIGLTISDRPDLKVGLGYSSSSVVTVSPDTVDVIIEVARRPGGPLTLETGGARPGGSTKGDSRVRPSR